MKRILAITLLLVFAAGVCFAASPQLACEKIFEKRDIRTKGHSLVAVNNPNDFFRSVTADNDPKLLQEVKKAFEQDRKLATTTVDGFDGEREYSIMTVNHNEGQVSIGFYWTDNGYVNLFVRKGTVVVNM